MKLKSKYFDSIRVKPDKDRRQREHHPVCAWPGCSAPGTHRAPRGRQFEGQYLNLCLDHVRDYNREYNFFQGLDDAAVSSFQKDALTGHRPTWKMGASGGTRSSPDFAQQRSGRAGYHNRMRDPFNLFGSNQNTPRERQAKPLEAKALETLGLTVKATSAEIKARYKELVKRHHPDANGGDRGSEDRFREVLQAYRMLKQAGLC